MLPSTLSIADNLTLRAVEMADAARLFEVVERNRAFLREWLPWLDFNQSVADTEAFIEKSMGQRKEGTGLVMLIVYDDEPTGVIGFNWIDPLHRACEVGYWIAEDTQGRGLITRSTRAMVDCAFNELALNRVNISVAVENTRSRAIPERLGFTQEGVQRQAEWLYDHFVDHAKYAMLRSEWVG